jgi:hypothetical protein
VRFPGRPVLGAVSGLFFGLWVAVDLQQFSIRPLDTMAVFGFPAVGLVLGLLLAWWAPFARRKAKSKPGPAPISRPAPAAEPEPAQSAEPPSQPSS